MNETTLTQLKILVERAVRPVRASTPRKRKMREELLAHVSGVFEEEAASLGDERLALERTARRFGNPAELTVQLQESLPARDALRGFAERLWFRPGEPALYSAVRQVLLVEAFGILFFLLLWLVVWAREGVLPMEALWESGSVLFGVAYLVFGFTCLAEWMRRALYGSTRASWRRAALGAAVFGLLGVPVLGLWTWLDVARRDPEGVLSLTVLFVWHVGLVTGGAVAAAHQTAAQMRYHQEWASLPID